MQSRFTLHLVTIPILSLLSQLATAKDSKEIRLGQESQAGAPASPPNEKLETGALRRGSLAAGQAHAYAVAFETGQYLAVTAKPSNIDVSLALIDPRGRPIERYGFAANLAALEDPGIGRARYLHIASHGCVNKEHSELSGLALSLVDAHGRPRSGILRLHRIYALRLDADEVCENTKEGV